MVLYKWEPVNSVDANSVWESLVGTFVRGRKTRRKSKRSFHHSYAAYSVKI